MSGGSSNMPLWTWAENPNEWNSGHKKRVRRHSILATVNSANFIQVSFGCSWHTQTHFIRTNPIWENVHYISFGPFPFAIQSLTLVAIIHKTPTSNSSCYFPTLRLKLGNAKLSSKHNVLNTQSSPKSLHMTVKVSKAKTQAFLKGPESANWAFPIYTWKKGVHRNFKSSLRDLTWPYHQKLS